MNTTGHGKSVNMDCTIWRVLRRVSPGAANTTTSRACALRIERLEESNIQYEHDRAE